jgi:hypothetical protein
LTQENRSLAGESSAGDPPKGDQPTVSPPPDTERQAKVNLALQVAQIAAQVSGALRGPDQEARDELEARLAMAQERLEQQGAPVGLIPFLAVMRGLLKGENVDKLAAKLPVSYRAVYNQLAVETQATAPGSDRADESGTMTVREVIDEVARNVVLAMSSGTLTQRLRMANTLLAMQQEAADRPDLSGLCDLLLAARILLQGDDPGEAADALRGPFKAKWDEIVAAVGEPADE